MQSNILKEGPESNIPGCETEESEILLFYMPKSNIDKEN